MPLVKFFDFISRSPKEQAMDADMYKAVENDRPYELQRILRRGGDPNAWMEDPVRISGKSILHVCCEKGRYKCAEVFIYSCL